MGRRKEPRTSGSSARGTRAARSVKPTVVRRKLDFSDIPEATDEQLRAMRRVGRPPLGDSAKRLIAIRLDPDVLGRVRRQARERGVGYQTLINEVLARYAKRLA